MEIAQVGGRSCLGVPSAELPQHDRDSHIFIENVLGNTMGAHSSAIWRHIMGYGKGRESTSVYSSKGSNSVFRKIIMLLPIICMIKMGTALRGIKMTRMLLQCPMMKMDTVTCGIDMRCGHSNREDTVLLTIDTRQFSRKRWDTVHNKSISGAATNLAVR